jgi:penicillin-binding protein 1A
MEMLLVKIFATALALSQVAINPESVKTQFDPVQDKAEVVRLLRDGCANMQKAFHIENIDLDGMIDTAMNDKRAVAGEVRAFKGIKFDDLYNAYREFCKNEQVTNSVVDTAVVINFYNKALAELPDHTKLKGTRPPGTTFVLDAKNANYAELFEPDNRRIWVPIADIPPHVLAAFIAAEDKRFYQHKGIDERSVIRAFVGMVGGSGRRPQGGSTITQQLVKNLLVGDDVTYERKIREIIVASRLEGTLTKEEILELYVNSIFLGRGSWGVAMAARSYFGKPIKDLSLDEGVMLAGLAKGPNAYSPDKNPQRSHDRATYVLNRMQEDGTISAATMKETLGKTPAVIAYEKPRRDNGYYFVEHIAREAKSVAGIENLTASSYTVRSTIKPDLQRAAEIALQDGLARYEQSMGRATFIGAEMNLAESVRRYAGMANRTAEPWQMALENARLPLYDVHWTSGIVTDIGRGKGTSGKLLVGLRDGTTLPLTTPGAARQKLALHDVVYVNVIDGSEKIGPRAELRIRPSVQGGAVIVENATGRVLAMAGGFSYPLSQINRVTQTRRQPGSALKPLTYLAALNNGLQPNTLVRDSPITLAPINKTRGHVYARDYWTPRNYDRGSSGVITLRRALENSKNLVTARLLDGGVAEKPEDSLDRVCALAMEAQLYADCVRFYPFVLGAQPVRLLDLAGFYAAVANEGGRPTPHVIESIEQDGRTVYSRSGPVLTQMKLADRPAFYQLKTILQGVVARGTARSMAELSPFIAGKTGTSDEENDTWFMGFTNDVTIGVWVGYDNSDGKRRTLGRGQTGSRVALPIFHTILNSIWNGGFATKTAMNGPTPDAQRQLAAVQIILNSGERASEKSTSGFTEYFRTDPSGRVAETQHRLVARASAEGDYDDNVFGRQRSQPNFDLFGGLFGRIFPPFESRRVPQPEDDRPSQRTRRVDPDYPGFRLFR